MKVINRLAEFEYVPMQDRELPEEEQTVFTIRGLPYDIQQSLESKISPKINMPGSALSGGSEEGFKSAFDDASVSVDVAGGRNELQFDILRNGVVSVQNLFDSEGNELKYPGPSAPVNSLKNWWASWFTSSVRVEIANAITAGSVITEDDVKN